MVWYNRGRAAWRGSALGLNLVLVQNLWALTAASQGATVGRQDIPAQDEEMSVTTCYANPRAKGGKRGEGERTGKTVFRQGLCVCVHTGRGDFVCVCVYVVIVCFGGEVSCVTHDSRVGIVYV